MPGTDLFTYNAVNDLLMNTVALKYTGVHCQSKQHDLYEEPAKASATSIVSGSCGYSNHSFLTGIHRVFAFHQVITEKAERTVKRNTIRK